MVYCVRIQSVYLVIKLNFEIGFITNFSSLFYQNTGELLLEFIAAFFIGFSKVTTGNHLPKTQVIIFGFVSLKAYHQLTHAISRG